MKPEFEALVEKKRWEVADGKDAIVAKLSVPDLLDQAALAKSEGYEALRVRKDEFGLIDDQMPSFRSFREKFLEASGLPDLTLKFGSMMVMLETPPALVRAKRAVFGIPYRCVKRI